MKIVGRLKKKIPNEYKFSRQLKLFQKKIIFPIVENRQTRTRKYNVIEARAAFKLKNYKSLDFDLNSNLKSKKRSKK